MEMPIANNGDLVEVTSAIADCADSSTVDSRIAARRKRIVERQQKSDGILPEIKTNVTLEPLRKGLLQIANSDDRLAKLTLDTGALVYDVRTNSVAYDDDRKLFVQNATARRQEVLERESKVSAENYKDISNRWMNSVKIKVPSELQQLLITQKNACDAVIQEKDKLIDNLKLEIEESGLKYDEMIDRQADAMEMAVRRVREQLKLLSDCYAEEMTKIEIASIEEWQELFENQKNEWDEAVQEMKTSHVRSLEKTRFLFDKWESDLDTLRAKRVEDYRRIETELELDIECLEKCLQNLKATLQLNEEKLDYGCQVLRKRKEEQIKVKSNQKRKMSKLNDLVISLKLSLAKLENDNRDNVCHIDRDCKRLQKQILNHDNKFRHLLTVENAKLEELWRLNDETAKNRVENLLQIDRDICEKVLRIPWKPSAFNPEICQQSQITYDDKTSARLIRCVTLFRVGILATRGRLLKTRKSPRVVVNVNDKLDPPPDVRRLILRSIASEATFLIEKPLRDMIEAFPVDEQILMRLDAIFLALNIRNDSEVEKLVKCVYEKCYEDNKMLDSEQEYCLQSYKFPPLTLDASEVKCELVLKAIDDFLQKKQRQYSLQRSLKNVKKIKNETSKKTNLDWKCTEYWKQFISILPESRQGIWKALSIGVQKLRQLKLECSKLEDDNKQLQVQNEELKFLLSEYIENKKVDGNKYGEPSN